METTDDKGHEPQEPKHRKLDSGMVVIITCSCIIGLILIGSMMWAAIYKQGQGSAVSSQDSAVGAAPPPESPTFADAQNDTEGYQGREWGSKSNANADELESEQIELLGLVFNLPIKKTVVAGSDVGERIDTSLLPSFHSESSDKVAYIYQNDALSAALVTLDAHNYDTVQSTIEGKGYPQINESSMSYRSLGDASDGDSTEIQAILYKRGSTNTRIYLMKYINHSPLGDSWSAYLLYLPNHYYNAISAAIQNSEQQQRDAEASEAEQKAEPDVQAVQ